MLTCKKFTYVSFNVMVSEEIFMKKKLWVIAILVIVVAGSAFGHNTAECRRCNGRGSGTCYFIQRSYSSGRFLTAHPSDCLLNTGWTATNVCRHCNDTGTMRCPDCHGTGTIQRSQAAQSEAERRERRQRFWNAVYDVLNAVNNAGSGN